jgi:acyl-phosphate glycerol 3-phosphate acyltransferase
MIFLLAIFSYLLGSIPNGYLIGKYFFKKDIRTLGSGNVGSTNVLRNFGKGAGLATFFLDSIKGFLAVCIADKVAGVDAFAICLVCVVLGHMYSIFLHFKSGKGVATAFGAFVYIDVKFALIVLAVFLIVVIIGRMVSLGSILAAFSAIVVGYFYFGLGKLYYAIFISAAMIIYKHRSNIKRIKNHEESKIF